MEMFLGIAGSTVALFGTFLLYIVIAMLIFRTYYALFGKKDKAA